MSRWKPAIVSFTAGELSPRLEGRVDLSQYAQGCRLVENAVILPHGGLARRSGTRFVEEVRDSADQGRLIPFISAEDAAYVLEAGDLYFRFYNNEGQLSGPVEVVTPYLASELKDIQWAQSADVMYLVHPNHPLYKLSRTSATTFTMAEVIFPAFRSPYQIQNTQTSLTVTVTGAGPFTLTFSSDIGLDAAKDIGRLVAIADTTGAVAASTGDVYDITGVTSGAIATANLVSDLAGETSAGPTSEWALSMQSDTEGFRAITFHEGRLWLGGSASAPNRVASSQSDDFENFRLGTGLANESIQTSLVGDRSPNIQWMASAGEKLHVGGLGMEFFLKGENNDILTPGGVVRVPSTSIGSEHIQPVLVGSKIIFAQRAARKLRELGFRASSTAESGFEADDLSILAEHILRTPVGGVTEMQYQQDPDSIVWCVRADGELVGITREIQQQVIGAHRQIAGGSYNGSKAQIESAAVIPAPDGSHDQVWLLVVRTIDGSTVRYVEFIEDPFDPEVRATADDLELIQALEQGFFVDSGLTLDVPLAITGITQADPVVVSVVNSLSNGDRIRIRDVVGTTELNHNTYLVAGVTGTTVELTDLDGIDIDGTSFTAYVTGGTVREEVTALSGLTHLEGETVQILADGSPEPDQVVSSGAITLDNPASIVHVGLGYVTNIETQRVTGGGRLGAGIGDVVKLKSANLRLYETLGILVGQGPRGDDLERFIFRVGDDPMDRAIPLFSGDVFIPLESEHDTEPTVYVRQDQPLPLTVLAITPDAEIGER